MNSHGEKARDEYLALLNAVKAMRGLAEDELLAATTVEEIRGTALALIAAVFAEDGTFGTGESEFLRAWFSNDCSDETNYEVIRSYLGKWSQVASTIPWFLRQAIAYDCIHETKYTAYLIARLRDIGELAASADGKSEKREENLVISYCAMLGQHAQQSGLATALEDIDADPGRHGTQDDRQAESLDSLMKSLDGLIGLGRVKQEVAALINLIKVRRMREKQGLQIPPMTLHLVFSGNPGTGKTTVARMLGKIYQAMGLLQKGQLVETDKSGLIAAYLGQTPQKVQEVVAKAMGGVLFIDEAYALADNAEYSYGTEAIETLLKLMEDHRDNLVVIVAGYTREMETFLNANPGLRSRFNRFIHFEDYGPQELYDIFIKFCADSGYGFDEECALQVAALLEARYDARDENFGNARTVRNFFEQTISNQANRLALMEFPSPEDLQTLLSVDLPVAVGLR